MEKVDCIIIGAGVVGLAIAHRIGNRQRDIVLVERHEAFGRETSSRNSEVIHGGIYYPASSLKAALCVKGRHLLYQFCEQNRIPCQKPGKLIVALKQDDEEVLRQLLLKARANGVDDLELINKKKISELEPRISTPVALYSPSTGILDSHGLMKKLESSAEEKGVMCVYGCTVTHIDYRGPGFVVAMIDADGKTVELMSDVVINSAGLESDAVAEMAGIDIEKSGYRIYYSKGEYFKVNNTPSWYMKHLVYPPPGTASLGIHTVLDLRGQLKLGPSAFYVDSINYDVDETHGADFYNAVKQVLPFVELTDLSPDMAGIRPKRQGPGTGFADFIITDEKEAGFPGLINLIGIESPGLTSCLAIAEYVETIYNNL
ncbi:MAG: NAD(P)/FAD-dependent oxidoreductase [Spirochaetales bacterium]|nr:NAD(P)/FAD-dependent oxidoreductase [Spirochaetales bacterium]